MNLEGFDSAYKDCVKYLDEVDVENASKSFDKLSALYLEFSLRSAKEISKLEDKLETADEAEKLEYRNLIEKLMEDYAFFNEHLKGIINIQRELGLTNAPVD